MEERLTITMDSVLDVPEEMIKKYNIKVIPITLKIGNRIFTDGEISPKKMIEMFYDNNKEHILTDPPSTEDYYRFFTQQAHMGHTVLHLSASSKVSAAYENARAAAETFNRVHVIDTKTVSIGGIPIIKKIIELHEQGKKAEEIAEYIRKDFYKKVHISVFLNTLDNLHAAGRIRPVGKFLVLFFGLKPSAYLDPDDYFIPDKKFKGEKAVINYLHFVLGKMKKAEREDFYFAHADCDSDYVKKCLSVIDEERIFKNITVMNTGCSITSHFGKHFLMLCWTEK